MELLTISICLTVTFAPLVAACLYLIFNPLTKN